MKENIPINERIIFALDVSSHEEAMDLVEKLDGDIKFFKVGLQLFLAGWFPTIEAIIKRGNKVMVDLKFFDIPETVKLAVDQLKNRGVTFATVHGNDPILKAATQDKKGLKILAITVLTSFGENDMKEMGMTGSIRDLVLLRSKKALEIGCDGVVSSALEADEIRKELGSNFLIVTPGIRPGANIEDNEDDQKRIATAKEAFINGADYVVIGRPIRNSDDPIALIKSLQAEIEEGLSRN
jgi:orotidine-5'-phosphate decarboxylase